LPGISLRPSKRGLFYFFKMEHPYRHLYVYLLEGKVKETYQDTFGKDFIGCWIEGEYSFLFFTSPSKQKVLQFISKRDKLRLIDQYHFSYEQWHGEEIRPFRVGKLLIVPPWNNVGEGIKIVIDPGVVFGTGLHPTTKDCLKAIQYLIEIERFRDVIDLGTGSGILAIASAVLGAHKVIAVDNNPLAVSTAKRNVLLNHLEDRVSVFKGMAQEFIWKKADLILSNLHYEVIRDIVEMKEALKDKRWIILSGLFRSEARDIKNRLKMSGFSVKREWDFDSIWHTLLLRNMCDGSS